MKNTEKSRRRAVGLLSGGLDSTLAARLMMEQGIEVHAINFVSPFCTCTAKSAGCPAVVSAVRQLGDIPLKRVVLREEYLEMVRNPRFGYGRAMNPCIDCRIMKIRKAGEYMREIGADFLFTGEVLGQRPMSQHRAAMETIDKASGMAGLIVRPLSCGLLSPTIPEQKGWIDRGQMLSIAGRSRKPQIELAHDFSINDYPCPAGGCLLTEPEFAKKLKLLLELQADISVRDVSLLKSGRLRLTDDGGIMIIARNAADCNALEQLAQPAEHLFVPEFSGPTVLLRGNEIDAALAAIIEYSKAPESTPRNVKHLYNGQSRTIALDLISSLALDGSAGQSGNQMAMKENSHSNQRH